MLLDLTLLDINFYKYQKNTIVFSICSLVIYNAKMIDEITDNLELYIQDCKEEKYKIYFVDFFRRINSSYNDIYDNNIINNINYLYSFCPFKDYSLVLECTQEIVNLYENIKSSKYNSAIQKFFIQLKEIKIGSFLEQTKEIIISEKPQGKNRKNEINIVQI